MILIEEEYSGLDFRELRLAEAQMIADLKAVVAGYRESFRERQERIMSLLAKKELNVYQIARKLFPEVAGSRLLMESYSMISEVYTHLQVLQAAGRVTGKATNEVLYYRC